MRGRITKDIYDILKSDDREKEDDIKKLIEPSKRFLFVNCLSFFRTKEISSNYFQLNGSLNGAPGDIQPIPIPIKLSVLEKMLSTFGFKNPSNDKNRHSHSVKSGVLMPGTTVFTRIGVEPSKNEDSKKLTEVVRTSDSKIAKRAVSNSTDSGTRIGVEPSNYKDRHLHSGRSDVVLMPGTTVFTRIGDELSKNEDSKKLTEVARTSSAKIPKRTVSNSTSTDSGTRISNESSKYKDRHSHSDRSDSKKKSTETSPKNAKRDSKKSTESSPKNAKRDASNSTDSGTRIGVANTSIAKIAKRVRSDSTDSDTHARSNRTDTHTRSNSNERSNKRSRKNGGNKHNKSSLKKLNFFRQTKKNKNGRN